MLHIVHQSISYATIISNDGVKWSRVNIRITLLMFINVITVYTAILANSTNQVRVNTGLWIGLWTGLDWVANHLMLSHPIQWKHLAIPVTGLWLHPVAYLQQGPAGHRPCL